MTIIKTYCDHCGKTLDSMADYNDVEIEAAHNHIRTDLCTKCFEKLNDVIRNFCKRGQ